TLTASAPAIVWGIAVTLTAQLSLAPDSLLVPPLAGRSVEFQASGDGSTWASIGTGLTAADGRASLAYRPVTNLLYRVNVAAAPDLGAVPSAPARVKARQSARLWTYSSAIL